MSSSPPPYSDGTAASPRDAVERSGQFDDLAYPAAFRARPAVPDAPERNSFDFARCLVEEESARAMLEGLRWKGEVVCPHCTAVETSRRMKTTAGRRGLWCCGACRRQFTVTVGTALSGTHIPLHLWVYSVHMLCASHRGVSASNLASELDVSYNAARAMLERVDRALYPFSQARTPGRDTERPLRWNRGRISLRPKTSVEVCDILVATV